MDGQSTGVAQAATAAAVFVELNNSVTSKHHKNYVTTLGRIHIRKYVSYIKYGTRVPLSFCLKLSRQVLEVISGGIVSDLSFVIFVTNFLPSVLEFIA